MKRLIILLLCCQGVAAQSTGMLENKADSLPPLPTFIPSPTEMLNTAPSRIKLPATKWRMTGNRWLTGGLIFTAGASKGFNETLLFHWKAFRKKFPNVNAKWFNPDISWRNKYKNGNPDAGAKFPLSTSVLVLFTDQYHLNTFINRLSWTSALVIKIGERKKPLKHYLLDFLYYSLCHQAGFALTYYPFK